jgi:MSHA pilin protein MshC
MTRPNGFSLLELVVVMVLAGILAAVAIPRFTDTESKSSWYFEQVKAALRYAQRQAVAQRRNVYVRIQATEVDLCYDPACSPGKFLQLPGTTNNYALAAPSSVSLSAITFSFNSLGQPLDVLGQPQATTTLSVAGHSTTVEMETGYVH